MVDVVPLKTLEDLWEWNSADIPTRLKAIPLEQYRESLNDQVETLICHDMKGGYQSEDRYIIFYTG